MGLSKWKLDYVQGAGEYDRIGAAALGVRSSALQEINSQSIDSQEWLNTAAALFDGSGNALSSTSGALNVYLNDQNGDIDVNISNASIAVTQSGSWTVSVDSLPADVDIRDLTHVSDSIRLGDGTNLVTVTNVASDYGLDVNLINASIAVTATDLDIRDLTQSDEITVYQGTSPWVVSATDLDIRDLTHASDSIKIGDGTEFLAVNADGSINVVVTESTGDGAIKNSAASVTTTAAEIVATPLTGRDEIIIENNGDKEVYVGFDNSVTSANGLVLGKGSSVNFRADITTNIWLIAESGTQDVRILEIAY